ncbi:hypothetical protein AGMMS50256_14840 [Betaproteobacteria bacterium]|nr:hypothetical protein AGMMS50256_14840 [Betaproteobacteria bacterium]
MPITLCFDRTYVSHPIEDLLELNKRRFIRDLWLAPDDGDCREMNAISEADQYAKKYDAVLKEMDPGLSDTDKTRYLAERERMSGCRCMAWAYYEINRGARQGGLRGQIKARLKSCEQLSNAEGHFKEHIAQWEKVCRKSGETNDYLSLFWAYCKMYGWELQWRERLDSQLEEDAQKDVNAQKDAARNLRHYAQKVLETAEIILGRIHMKNVAALAEQARRCLEGDDNAIASSPFFGGYPAGGGFFEECVPYAAVGRLADSFCVMPRTSPQIDLPDSGEEIKRHWLTGLQCERNGQREETITAFEAALAIPATSAEDLNDQAVVRMTRFTLGLEGYTDEAQDLLEKAVVMTPDVSAFWANLGIVREIDGQLSSALAAYERAVELEAGENAQSWCNQASVLFYLGRWYEAMEAARKAEALDPGNMGALILRGRLWQFAKVAGLWQFAETTEELALKILNVAEEKEMLFAGTWNMGLMTLEEQDYQTTESLFDSGLEDFPDGLSQPPAGALSFHLAQ